MSRTLKLLAIVLALGELQNYPYGFRELHNCILTEKNTNAKIQYKPGKKFRGSRPLKAEY